MYKAIVSIDNPQTSEQDLILSPGKNLRNGRRELSKEFKNLTTLEIDLLNVASSIFACDIAFKRGERENISRKIELTIPVVNYAIFTSIQDQLQYALFFLSHDAWKIEFLPSEGVPEATKVWEKESDDAVLLFSGGLDAFSAAVYLGDQNNKVELVSHITANPTVRGAQERLFAYLKTEYPDQFNHTPIYVSGRKTKEFEFPSGTNREDSQRTRSLLFLTLAGIIARRKGFQDIIYIAENGQLAIHLPLTAARISAFSTYTAHPEFLNEMKSLLGKILGYPISIKNPFLYKTKAEVIENVATNHSEPIKQTISCWKASRIQGDLNHCGVCIPCLIRRIALEFNGSPLPEYRDDIFREAVANLPSNHKGKRNIAEMGEFVKIFESVGSQAELEEFYPDLVNDHFDAEQAANMYIRFAKEARTVFYRYPNLKKFLA